MSWKLWLDDQIYDINAPARHVPEGFLGAENCEKAKQLVIDLGVPEFMDLDHDLGESETTIDFLIWLECHMNGESADPDELLVTGMKKPPKYRVHSENVEVSAQEVVSDLMVGAENVKSYLVSWEYTAAVLEAVEKENK